MSHPVRIDEFIGRQYLSGGAVENVKEPILRGLQQHIPVRAGDSECRQHDGRCRVVVPALTGRLLVMPDVLAGIGVHGDDRGDEEIVAARRTAVRAVPWRAIAGSEVHKICFRVVGNAIPGVAATTTAPIAFRVPGLGRHFQGLALVGLGGITGHGIEAPYEPPGLQVIGGHVAARVEFGAAIADHNHLSRDLRRARDGVGARPRSMKVSVCQRTASVLCIQRIQDAFERGDIDLALPHRDTTIDEIAAAAARVLQLQRRLELPQQAPGRGIERIDTPRNPGGVHHAIDDDRRRSFHAAVRTSLQFPGKAQPRGRLSVDLIQGRVVCLAGVTARRQPGARLLVNVLQPRRGQPRRPAWRLAQPGPVPVPGQRPDSRRPP